MSCSGGRTQRQIQKAVQMNLAVLTTGPMRIVGVLLVAALLTAPAWAAEPNYCHDEASWHEWHKVLSENAGDDRLFGLYAMRRGLCGLVEAGTIDINRATRIFEAAREELAGKWSEESRQSKPRM